MPAVARYADQLVDLGDDLAWIDGALATRLPGADLGLWWQADSSVTGTAAVTLAAATSTANGTHTPPNVTGTATPTLAAATSSASGAHGVSGTVAETLTSAAAAATGISATSGVLTFTLADTDLAILGAGLWDAEITGVSGGQRHAWRAGLKVRAQVGT